MQNSTDKKERTNEEMKEERESEATTKETLADIEDAEADSDSGNGKPEPGPSPDGSFDEGDETKGAGPM